MAGEEELVEILQFPSVADYCRAVEPLTEPTCRFQFRHPGASWKCLILTIIFYSTRLSFKVTNVKLCKKV